MTSGEGISRGPPIAGSHRVDASSYPRRERMLSILASIERPVMGSITGVTRSLGGVFGGSVYQYETLTILQPPVAEVVMALTAFRKAVTLLAEAVR